MPLFTLFGNFYISVSQICFIEPALYLYTFTLDLWALNFNPPPFFSTTVWFYRFYWFYYYFIITIIIIYYNYYFQYILNFQKKCSNIPFLFVVVDFAAVVVISALILDQQMQVSRHDVYTLFLLNCWMSTLQDRRMFSVSWLAFREP